MDSKVFEKPRMIIKPRGTKMTEELLKEVLDTHRTMCTRYSYLNNMYVGQHDILSRTDKADYKPDNRLVANFAKYIVDTMGGFFMGIPVKASHSEEKINSYIQTLDAYNNQDDNNAELAKMCDIYGHGFELLFIDEDANVGITRVSPLEAFIVYDDSILHKPMYGIRVYTNSEGETEGSVSDHNTVRHFKVGETVPAFTKDETNHYFGGVPLIEYVGNEERLGIFEPAITLINAYNNALSEKCNDVEYYADAYLLVLGAALEENDLTSLRDNRIINLNSSEAHNIVVEFLQKPQADDTQENLINRLEKLIFHLCMVANINDENFGNTTGISLRYKLQSMENLALTKERKFTAGMNKRYRLISNLPGSKIPGDTWMGIEYKFTRNLPNNLLEEAQIAGALAGIVSKETQLKVLSVVGDPQTEMNKIDEETTESAESLSRSSGDNMYKITSILNDYKKGRFTRAVAIKMFQEIGVSEEDATGYLDDKDEGMLLNV